jgi:hypothetical protein
MPRWCLVPVVSLLLLVLAPAGAPAAIKIYANSPEATYLGQVKKLKCKLKRDKKVFLADGKTTNGVYDLQVNVFNFTKFGREYNVAYGNISTTVGLEGAGQDFSNTYPFPGGQPPNSAGAVALANRGAKVGVGVYALPNADYSQGVAIAGVAKCDYPRRR